MNNENIPARVGKLEVTAGEHREQLKALREWQKTQNGSLSRMEAKMDALNKWIIGLMGGVIVSLALLLFNIVAGAL